MIYLDHNATTPVHVDGTSCAVEILKKVGTEAEVQIFEGLAAVDQELAEDLRSRMFVFEDILRLHTREVQMVLREVDGQKLAGDESGILAGQEGDGGCEGC